MKCLGIHHVAFAHRENADVHEVLNNVLGLDVVHVERTDELVERMIATGSGLIQTLEPVGNRGVVKRFTDQNGPGLHHIALEVADVSSAVAELMDRGVEMVDEKPRSGGAGTLIAFIHPKATAGLLVELVEVLTEPPEPT